VLLVVLAVLRALQGADDLKLPTCLGDDLMGDSEAEQAVKMPLPLASAVLKKHQKCLG